MTSYAQLTEKQKRDIVSNYLLHHQIPLFQEQREAEKPIRYRISFVKAQQKSGRITTAQMYAVINTEVKELRKLSKQFDNRRDREFIGWRNTLGKVGFN